MIVSAELAVNGEVMNESIKLLEPSFAPDSRYQKVFEAMRRAIIRCSPFDLPREKYAQWQNIEVVGSPDGFVTW